MNAVYLLQCRGIDVCITVSFCRAGVVEDHDASIGCAWWLVKSNGTLQGDCRNCGVDAQALFGNLGDHKLGPAVEARAEVLSAEAGEDSSKQVCAAAAAAPCTPPPLPAYYTDTYTDTPVLKCTFASQHNIADLMHAQHAEDALNSCAARGRPASDHRLRGLWAGFRWLSWWLWSI